MADLKNWQIDTGTQVGQLLTVVDVGGGTPGLPAVDASQLTDLSAGNVVGTLNDTVVPQSAVVQHEGAITVTESQISDLQNYLLNITNEPLSDLSDVSVGTSPTGGQVLGWDGVNSRWKPRSVSLNNLDGTSITTTTDPSGASQTNTVAISNIGSPRHLRFKPDGTKAFVTSGNDSDVINEYSLTTPYDMSTSTYVQAVGIDIGQANLYSGLAFSPDGIRLYVEANGSVYQYSMSSAWDITTLSFVQSNPIPIVSTASGIEFKSDGTNLFVGDSGSNVVRRFNLATPWDVSTINTNSGTFVNGPSIGSFVRDIAFNADGTSLWILDLGNDTIDQYDIAAWDNSTATFVGSIDTSSATTPYGFDIDDSTGTYVCMVDQGVPEFVEFGVPEKANVSDGSVLSYNTTTETWEVVVANTPEHATDSATDAFVSTTNTMPPADGDLIVRDFQSASTTTTPTLDSKTITDRDGSALWDGALSGPHRLQYASGTDTYLLLDPRSTAANVNNAPVARDSSGRAKFVDPSAAQDAATKAYVDLGDPTLETAVDATNSGANNLTEIDFTGIKSGAKRITVILFGISLTGTDDILVQIGDSGGFETSGYASTGNDANQTGTTGGTNSSAGFVIRIGEASSVLTGNMHLLKISGNSWVENYSGKKFTDVVTWGAGDKGLSGELDRVRVTPTGTDTFDGGTINIMVE